MAALPTTEDLVSLSRLVDHPSDTDLLATGETSQLEPISPELVLVDPELGRAARRELSYVRRPSRLEQATDGARDGEGRSIVAPAAPRRTPRRRWRTRALFVLLIVAAAVAGLGLASRLSPEPVRRAQRQVVPTASRQREATTSPTKHGSGVARSGSISKPPAKIRAKRRSNPRPPPAAKPVAPAVPSTRVFIWPAVKQAAFYKVEFFRRGRRVFVAWPATPRLALPARWTYHGANMRLVRGVYSWRVSPAYGKRSSPRLGQPIVRSTWVART